MSDTDLYRLAIQHKSTAGISPEDITALKHLASPGDRSGYLSLMGEPSEQELNKAEAKAIFYGVGA